MEHLNTRIINTSMGELDFNAFYASISEEIEILEKKKPIFKYILFSNVIGIATKNKLEFSNEEKLKQYLINQGFHKGNIIDFLRVKEYYKVNNTEYKLHIEEL